VTALTQLFTTLNTATLISEWYLVSYCSHPVDTTQCMSKLENVTRIAIWHINFKGMINLKQIRNAPTADRDTPLRNQHTIKHKQLTTTLKNVWHATTSVCCLCWATLVRNYSFWRIVGRCNMLCAMLQSIHLKGWFCGPHKRIFYGPEYMCVSSWSDYRTACCVGYIFELKTNHI
jgi:hypothetical protein